MLSEQAVTIIASILGVFISDLFLPLAYWSVLFRSLLGQGFTDHNDLIEVYPPVAEIFIMLGRLRQDCAPETVTVTGACGELSGASFEE